MKIDSWAVSDVSLLSSTAREYATKSFPFFISCLCRLAENSQTRSATVFRFRLTFKKFCFLSEHTMSQTDHALYDKLFIIKGPADFAMSAATIKLAFTAASLFDFAFMDIVSWEIRHFFISCTFAASALRLGPCTFHNVFFFIVSSSVTFFRYSHVSSAHKTNRSVICIREQIICLPSVLKAPVVHLSFGDF